MISGLLWGAVLIAKNPRTRYPEVLIDVNDYGAGTSEARGDPRDDHVGERPSEPGEKPDTEPNADELKGDDYGHGLKSFR